MELKNLETIKVDLSEGIAELSINRPRALNALNEQVLDELALALDELAGFESLRCLILTGSGDKAFVAGADIEAMHKMSPEQALAFTKKGHVVADKLAAFPVPVLGAVNGYALGGGCEMALACDILYAADKAKFGQPEVKLGLIPGFGGTARLPVKIGHAAAAEWIFTGEIFSAQQAQALGLVREVTSVDALLPRVREVAQLIAKRSPVAVRAAKRALAEQQSRSLAAALETERAQFSGLFSSEDMAEGTKAFLEKREPSFSGR